MTRPGLYCFFCGRVSTDHGPFPPNTVPEHDLVPFPPDGYEAICGAQPGREWWGIRGCCTLRLGHDPDEAMPHNYELVDPNLVVTTDRESGAPVVLGRRVW